MARLAGSSQRSQICAPFPLVNIVRSSEAYFKSLHGVVIVSMHFPVVSDSLALFLGSTTLDETKADWLEGVHRPGEFLLPILRHRSRSRTLLHRGGVSCFRQPFRSRTSGRGRNRGDSSCTGLTDMISSLVLGIGGLGIPVLVRGSCVMSCIDVGVKGPSHTSLSDSNLYDIMRPVFGKYNCPFLTRSHH